MMTLGGNVDKFRRLGEELHNFLMGRGSLLHSLEELNEKLDSLTKIRGSMESTVSQRQSLEQRIEETEQAERKLRAEVAEIRENPKMKEYVQIDSELRELRSELLRTGFSRLGRPLKKLISISERGDYPLQIDVRESAKEYAKKPFTTFLNEEDGYPRLKGVMSALSNAVSGGKLALKQREAKKVIERNEQVVGGESLAKIHSKAKELKHTHDGLLVDRETADLVQRLKEVRQNGRTNHTLQKELRTDLRRTLENERRLDEQIGLLLREIEAFVRKFSGTTPRLQLA
jgi:chromosome segregation ATPase